MSTPPNPYERQANFTSFEQQNPTRPKPGVSLDAELNAIRATLNAALLRLGEIQRDDGALANGSVGPDTFSREALVLIGSQLTPRGNWAASTVYNPRDLVQNGGISYIAVIAHVSTTFSADLALGRWQTISSSSGVASSISFTPTGTIAATNVQDAIAEVAAEAASGGGTLPANVSALAGLSLTANTIPYATAPGAMALANFTAFARTLTSAADAAGARSALGLTIGTSAGNVIALDGSARLPAVDASQLTGINIPDESITAGKLANTLDLSSKTLTLPTSLTTQFSRQFVSSELTIANNGTATLAHSLSAVPKLVQIRLICKVADLNYAVNDEIVWGTMFQGFDKGVSIIVNNTNIIYRYAAVSAPFSYVDKNTGNVNALNNSSWRMVIRAWA